MTYSELGRRLAEVADAIADPESKASQLLLKLIQDLMIEQSESRDQER